MIGIRFADGLSAGGYEGVRLAEAEGRAAKRSQEPERKYLSALLQQAVMSVIFI